MLNQYFENVESNIFLNLLQLRRRRGGGRPRRPHTADGGGCRRWATPAGGAQLVAGAGACEERARPGGGVRRAHAACGGGEQAVAHAAGAGGGRPVQEREVG